MTNAAYAIENRERENMPFTRRHIGPSQSEISTMLKSMGFSSLDELVSKTVPSQIRAKQPLELPEGLSETEALVVIRKIADKNEVRRSLIGMGYSGTITPTVILRNILENPGWYTQYTPYQAEIAQGRLEALLNFQTMICDFTGFEISNASLLDEATAAAEAMTMCHRATGSEAKNTFFISKNAHPQTIAVVKTRALPLGIDVEVGDELNFSADQKYFGVYLQYPDTFGEIRDYSQLCNDVHSVGALVVVGTDLAALALLTPPAEFGADIAVGNSQRFGVPFGFGGPHAGFISCSEKYKRTMPGRLVGVSKDSSGKPALRLAMQTREQHIRREKATSNICTAQVLLAIMASMYCVYHGPSGIRRISNRIFRYTALLAEVLKAAGLVVENSNWFDTLTVAVDKKTRSDILVRAEKAGFNLRQDISDSLGVSLDETVTEDELKAIIEIFTAQKIVTISTEEKSLPSEFSRKSEFLTHAVFNKYHSETEFLRYVTRLQSRDLSLANSMIPLGSCTMKLNATSEMIPVTWPEFANIHPFAPLPQAKGYTELITGLEQMLCKVTGFDAVSLQPNAGSQGEYAGLLAIRGFHQANNETERDICLIPLSAHGTNPASAIMAGMKVVGVKCDQNGNIDLADLKEKAEANKAKLAALMITYPSTHGVFEESIKDICQVIHDNGGQVYLDGANMNALVGISYPAKFGADVCHLNLHKTFCIPHGGGGPGVGPIGVKKHLAPYMPGHFHGLSDLKGGAVSAAPWGSAAILPIPWMYIQMMGGQGLQEATEIAILNANYIAKRLEPHYPVLYTGANGLVAHECILDLRSFKQAGIEVEDVAKRLMDYGFHAPTISWPVAGTMMIEPTESESLYELDRFCEAMIAIRQEIAAVEGGTADKENNVLKNAPHTAEVVISDSWERPYSRELAAYPVSSLRDYKFWPAVGRIDNAYGDRNLICTCGSVEEFE
ncbi:MAG: aminomethyl-transferring glycine dehydrogenase [Deltaproteobacteria bacterium]|nr:aminomethyl-transferring glycine dehydrogenase [Deltaproteobacteria bacterium]